MLAAIGRSVSGDHLPTAVERQQERPSGDLPAFAIV
jgi:hypothetical protein